MLGVVELRDRVDVLGVLIDRVTLQDALVRCRELLAEERGETALVVTPNAEFVEAAQRNPEFRRILNNAELAVPDGIGVVIASRLLGTPLAERVAGVDLVGALLAQGADLLGEPRPLRVYLLGATEEASAAAQRHIESSFPGVTVVGRMNGYFPAQAEEAVVKEIAATRPDLLLVALGAPRQEMFIERHRNGLGARLAIGVGGTLDVLAGVKARAPFWMQRMGLEWLYYLLRNPKRISRQLSLPRFFLRVLSARYRSGRPS